MKALSSSDRITLDRLLSSLAARLGGAVDIWGLVCLYPVVADRRAFLADKTEMLHALVVVIRIVLGESGLFDSQEGARECGERIAQGCHKLRDAFYVLERFRDVSLDEVQAATEHLAEGYREAQNAIHELRQAINLEVCYPRNQPESEAYYDNILRHLFELFRQEREPEAVGVQ